MKIQDKRSPAELAPRDIPLARPNVSQAEIEAFSQALDGQEWFWELAASDS